MMKKYIHQAQSKHTNPLHFYQVNNDYITTIKRLLLLLFFCVICFGHSHAQYYKATKEFQQGIRIHTGYTHSRIYNSSHIRNNRFLHDGHGILTGLSADILPISIEANLFFTRFPVAQVTPRFFPEPVRFRGGSFAINLNLFPISRHFYPYVGIGHQFSRFTYAEADFFINTSSGIWKGGFHFLLNRYISFKLEYTRSLPERRGSNLFDFRFLRKNRENAVEVFSFMMTFNLTNKGRE